MKVKKLTPAAIRPYGCIIDAACVKDSGHGNNFGILLKERSDGWRIGYLILRDKRIEKLESHPDSLETFEPVKGKIVIALARSRAPHKPELFFLDKPIVVNKGVWHEVLAVSTRCEIKIFENAEVKTRHYSLNKKLVI